MRALLIFCSIFIFGSSSFAQSGKQVKGVLQDSTGQSVIAASVKIISANDSVVTSSDVNGKFSFSQIKGDRFTISISSLGYESKTLPFQFNGKSDLNLGNIIMKESSQLLNEVNIDGTPLITIKEDTLEYRSKDYNLKDGAVTEDLLKKLDGVEVDKDGAVTAQGEKITRVRINGKDFFGGDVQTATKNLPADVIEKIQIIDDYGDQANLTGNKTGDPERVLNIEIAPSKNKGDFGQFRLGGGNEERYQATAMFNSFAENRQFSSLANLNNTNASLFDFNTQGGGARRGRGGRGGGGFGGNQSGLTNVGSIGLNYRKTFLDEKLTTYGSYSYSRNDNNTLSSAFDQYTYNDSLTVDQNNSTNQTLRNNHRLDWNLEYKISDNNYFKISPYFSYSSSEGSLFQDGQISTNNELETSFTRDNKNNSTSPNVGVSGLYNHRFNDKGRNIFIDFSLSNSSTDSERDEITKTFIHSSNKDSVQQQLIDLQNKRLNGGSSVSYLEPLGEHSNLELEYRFDFSNYDNNRIANSLGLDGSLSYNDELSNIYEYTFQTSNINLNYRYRTDKVNYTIGASAQPSTLKGSTQIDGEPIAFKRKATNFAPVGRFEYRFSRSKRLSFNYNGSANEPSYSQLQPFTDNSNPQFPVTGNPNLEAEFSHNLRFRYSNFDSKSGNSFFVMMNGTFTNNKVVSNRFQSFDPNIGTVQATSYLNADGYYSARGGYSYSKPFLDRQYVVSLNGSANFNNNISFADSKENIAKNWVLSQGLNVKINPREWLEVTPGVRYAYNTTENTLNSRNNTNISTWSMEMDGKVYFVPTFFWGFDLSKMSNSGYSKSIDASPFVINTYLEKQFLQGNRGSIRLQAYDLLNQQINISHEVLENITRDRSTNRLTRYFMLTLSYKFQKFAGGSGATDNGQGGPGQGGRRMGDQRP